MRKNLAAYTSVQRDYPGFLSINLVDHGFVEILMREEGKDSKEGQVSSITLSQQDFYALIGELVLNGKV